MLIIHGTTKAFRYSSKDSHLIHFCPCDKEKRTWRDMGGYECFMCKETLPDVYQLAHKLGVPFEYNV